MTASDRITSALLVGLEGDHISELIKRSGSYEADLLDAWGSIPFQSDHLMVDVGANIGNHSGFLGLTLPNPVLAIEPHPVISLLLRENNQRNSLSGKIVPVDACAWDEVGELSLTQQHAGNMSTFQAGTRVAGSGVRAAPITFNLRSGMFPLWWTPDLVSCLRFQAFRYGFDAPAFHRRVQR